MRMACFVAMLVIMVSSCAPTAEQPIQVYGSQIVRTSSQSNTVGVVKSYDSTTGTLTLYDGTTYVFSNNPKYQVPAGFTGPPEVGQDIEITYFINRGQRIVTDLEPATRGRSG